MPRRPVQLKALVGGVGVVAFTVVARMVRPRLWALTALVAYLAVEAVCRRQPVDDHS